MQSQCSVVLDGIQLQVSLDWWRGLVTPLSSAPFHITCPTGTSHSYGVLWCMSHHVCSAPPLALLQVTDPVP